MAASSGALPRSAARARHRRRKRLGRPAGPSAKASTSLARRRPFPTAGRRPLSSPRRHLRLRRHLHLRLLLRPRRRPSRLQAWLLRPLPPRSRQAASKPRCPHASPRLGPSGPARPTAGRPSRRRRLRPTRRRRLRGFRRQAARSGCCLSRLACQFLTARRRRRRWRRVRLPAQRPPSRPCRPRAASSPTLRTQAQRQRAQGARPPPAPPRTSRPAPTKRGVCLKSSRPARSPRPSRRTPALVRCLTNHRRWRGRALASYLSRRARRPARRRVTQRWMQCRVRRRLSALAPPLPLLPTRQRSSAGRRRHHRPPLSRHQRPTRFAQPTTSLPYRRRTLPARQTSSQPSSPTTSTTSRTGQTTRPRARSRRARRSRRPALGRRRRHAQPHRRRRRLLLQSSLMASVGSRPGQRRPRRSSAKPRAGRVGRLLFLPSFESAPSLKRPTYGCSSPFPRRPVSLRAPSQPLLLLSRTIPRITHSPVPPSSAFLPLSLSLSLSFSIPRDPPSVERPPARPLSPQAIPPPCPSHTPHTALHFRPTTSSGPFLPSLFPSAHSCGRTDT